MTTSAEVARDAVNDYLDPARAAVQQRMRDARRAAVRGRHAVEDLTAETALRVRRRPLSAMALVGVAGVVSGCVVGFVLAQRARRT